MVAGTDRFGEASYAQTAQRGPCSPDLKCNAGSDHQRGEQSLGSPEQAIRPGNIRIEIDRADRCPLRLSRGAHSRMQLLEDQDVVTSVTHKSKLATSAAGVPGRWLREANREAAVERKNDQIASELRALGAMDRSII
jgi:hypothetical protein